MAAVASPGTSAQIGSTGLAARVSWAVAFSGTMPSSMASRSTPAQQGALADKIGRVVFCITISRSTLFAPDSLGVPTGDVGLGGLVPGYVDPFRFVRWPGSDAHGGREGKADADTTEGHEPLLALAADRRGAVSEDLLEALLVGGWPDHHLGAVVANMRVREELDLVGVRPRSGAGQRVIGVDVGVGHRDADHAL